MAVATARRRIPSIAPVVPSKLKQYFAAKLAAELGPHNVKRLLDERRRDVILLDVRSEEGYREGHLPGAINVPFEGLPARLKDLPKQSEIISYCWDVTCLLSTKASYILASKGYKAREMIGGFESWKQAGFPVER